MCLSVLLSVLVRARAADMASLAPLSHVCVHVLVRVHAAREHAPKSSIMLKPNRQERSVARAQTYELNGGSERFPEKGSEEGGQAE